MSSDYKEAALNFNSLYIRLEQPCLEKENERKNIRYIPVFSNNQSFFKNILSRL